MCGTTIDIKNDSNEAAEIHRTLEAKIVNFILPTQQQPKLKTRRFLLNNFTKYFEPMNRAIERSECCICLDPLCRKPCAMLFRQHRVCLHYFHEECILQSRIQSCPICRAPYDRTVTLVDPIQEPETWFDMIDKDGSGSLSHQEVLEGLKATVDIDWRRLETDIGVLFRRWDVGGSGEITLDEFLKGPLIYIERNRGGSPDDDEVPDITSDPTGWFKFWDVDGNNSLQKDEVARALIKTLRLREHGKYGVSVEEIVEVLSAVWSLFDHDNSDGIDVDEFISPDGLCETILASVNMSIRK